MCGGYRRCSWGKMRVRHMDLSTGRDVRCACGQTLLGKWWSGWRIQVPPSSPLHTLFRLCCSLSSSSYEKYIYSVWLCNRCKETGDSGSREQTCWRYHIFEWCFPIPARSLTTTTPNNNLQELSTFSFPQIKTTQLCAFFVCGLCKEYVKLLRTPLLHCFSSI